jgi:energy-coupling factor transporter ATP-binding protein EcfA2
MVTVQEVKIKDFKILKNLEVEVKGNNLILYGDNGVGKSSFMQFIEIAFGKATNIPPNLMGEGEVIADKNGNEYLLQVKIKDGKSVVTVTGPEGLKDNRKSALSTLFGAIDFDIDEFVKMSDSESGRKKQVEIYKGLLPTEVIEEITKHQRKIKVDEDERTATGREVKKLKGAIESNKFYEPGKTYTIVDIAGTQKEIEAANEANVKYDKVVNGIADRNEKILDLEKQIKELMDKVEANKVEITAGQEWLSKTTRIDTEELAKTLASAAQNNTLAVQLAELKENEDAYGEFTALIQSSREAIATAIRDMESPVEGLEFDEDQLIYNGIPVSLSTLSTSEIIQLGCKLKMAQNPEFGVLFIEHGESLGEARLKEIQDMAKENNWQIIMEQVQRGTGKLQIEIMAD